MTPAALRSAGVHADCDYIPKRRCFSEIYGERPGEVLSALLFKGEMDASGLRMKPLRVKESLLKQWLFTASDVQTIRLWLNHLEACRVVAIRRGQNNAREVTVDFEVLRQDLDRWKSGDLLGEKMRPARSKPLRETTRSENTPRQERHFGKQPEVLREATRTTSGNNPNPSLLNKNSSKNPLKNKPSPAPPEIPDLLATEQGAGGKQTPSQLKKATPFPAIRRDLADLMDEFREMPLVDFATAETGKHLEAAVHQLATEEQRSAAVGMLRAELRRVWQEIERGNRDRVVERWGGIVYRMREVIVPAITSRMPDSRTSGVHAIESAPEDVGPNPEVASRSDAFSGEEPILPLACASAPRKETKLEAPAAVSWPHPSIWGPKTLSVGEMAQRAGVSIEQFLESLIASKVRRPPQSEQVPAQPAAWAVAHA